MMIFGILITEYCNYRYFGVSPPIRHFMELYIHVWALPKKFLLQESHMKLIFVCHIFTVVRTLCYKTSGQVWNGNKVSVFIGYLHRKSNFSHRSQVWLVKAKRDTLQSFIHIWYNKFPYNDIYVNSMAMTINTTLNLKDKTYKLFL